MATDTAAFDQGHDKVTFSSAPSVTFIPIERRHLLEPNLRLASIVAAVAVLGMIVGLVILAVLYGR